MSLVFYRAPFSSATPVATALAELDVPHEVITFDLQKKEQKRPEFLALNPNGKVPTLVVDGTPMFEALAILQWLGDRYGSKCDLWPEFDAPERLVAVSWCTWAYVTFIPVITRHHLATSERVPSTLHSAAMAEHSQEEAYSLLALLEQRLERQPFVLGNKYSLVDLVLANAVQYAAVCGLPPKDSPRVEAWLESCMKRPALATEWEG